MQKLLKYVKINKTNVRAVYWFERGIVMEHHKFKLNSKYKPTGDQPVAIDSIVKGIDEGKKGQTLLGVTGSGKTFTMANIIERTQKATLIIAHNKTLAAQLYDEFKEFFPDNAVEYFVSYYDYYQPEAYVPSRDLYIEKDSAINDEIDKLRHSATFSLLERNDVIIISSVSCIYGLGDPDDYKEQVISIRVGTTVDRDILLRRLIDSQYTRNDMNFIRGTFRVRGDVVEIFPANQSSKAIRVEFFGDEIDKITEVESLTGETLGILNHASIFPNSHYVTSKEKMMSATIRIEDELSGQLEKFKREDKYLEAQRIMERTNYDIEMLRETGFCSGIENYSRHISNREPGSRPFTLIDFFPDDFLMIIDESHVTIPQIGAMYNGDRSRKTNLVEYGFRLPSALDNRPLQFNEFEERINQILFVSATPALYEGEHSENVAEQIIRPTGLLDPIIDIRKIDGQIDDLFGEIQKTIDNKQKILVTTLTKKMAEDLTKFMENAGVRVKYLHSDIDTLERLEIIRDLRLDKFDVLVGINLLREGLDIPEVSLVAILDADKEGFLRSETSLIQTIGRAARNADGRVIMYADVITKSMQRAIEETERRRAIQLKYNEEHGIVPKTVIKKVHEVIKATITPEEKKTYKLKKDPESMNEKEFIKFVNLLEKDMNKEAMNLNFEKAAEIRDRIIELKKARL